MPRQIAARGKIIGASIALVDTLRKIELTYKIPKAALAIFAERGAGKESAALYAHECSDRSYGPFVVANGALLTANLAQSILFGHKKGAFTDAKNDSVGLFMKANGGTLFIDEIADLPLETQAMILRAIEYGEIQVVGDNKAVKVDVRIIVATNRNLQEMVERGTFRADLYDRLTDFIVHLPPLRERGGDIVLLAQHFLDGLGMDKVLTKSAKSGLLAYDWPGNVRQVRQVMLRCAAFSEGRRIEDCHVEDAIGLGQPSREGVGIKSQPYQICKGQTGKISIGSPRDRAGQIMSIVERMEMPRSSDIAKKLGVSKELVKIELRKLVQEKRICRKGRGPATFYTISADNPI